MIHDALAYAHARTHARTCTHNTYKWMIICVILVAKRSRLSFYYCTDKTYYSSCYLMQQSWFFLYLSHSHSHSWRDYCSLLYYSYMFSLCISLCFSLCHLHATTTIVIQCGRQANDRDSFIHDRDSFIHDYHNDYDDDNDCKTTIYFSITNNVRLTRRKVKTIVKPIYSFFSLLLLLLIL